MKASRLPFNIYYLSNDNSRIAGLLPVASLDIYDTNGDFHPQGLYSNLIFGDVGSEMRNKRHGFINLNCQVLHPKTYSELSKLGGLYSGILQGKMYAVWDEKQRDFIKSDIMVGQTGFSFFMSHFKDMVFKKTSSYRRELRLDVLNKYREESVIHYFIVIPAGLRDIRIDENGRSTEDDINRLYRRIISSAAGIPKAAAFENNPMYDRVRWSIQNAINDIYEYIVRMLEGKSGFIQDKWGSRNTIHSVRNVISGSDPGCEYLDGPRSFDSVTVLIGLFQMMVSCEPVLVHNLIPKGMLADIIENISGTVNLIDPKTLKSVPVTVYEKDRVRWGTAEGRSTILGFYKELTNRHKPVQIAGHYVKLIYKTSKGFRVIDSIDKIPKGSPGRVTPMTYAEYFYILLRPMADRYRSILTRYPVLESSSISPAMIHLKTTVTAQVLYSLNADLQIDEESVIYPEFPDTENQTHFMDTMSPHYTSLPGFMADFDGDVMSAPIVYSDEAIKEIDARLSDVANYVGADGTLLQKNQCITLALVYNNFSGF